MTDNAAQLKQATGQSGWIAVDLDGTLAYYDHWVSWDTIGAPIVPMLERVRKWVDAGIEVRIFTARVGFETDTCYKTGAKFMRADIVRVIQDWCEAQGLPRLPVTHAKDFRMVELWDDRCVQVIPNTGRTLAEEHAAEMFALAGKAAKPPA